jgi:hypothetical protein
MKKTCLLVALTLLTMSLMWGQGLETFDESNATASYADGSFVGDNGFTWTYGHSRDEGAFPIDGNGLMLRRASDSYVEATIPGGIGDFSFQYRKAFTGTSVRQLELIVNGVQVATSPEFGPTEPDPTIYTFNAAGINEEGNVTIRIKNVGTTTTNRQTVIDNISWTGYGDSVIPPSITNIVHTPEIVTADAEVFVSADVTEGDNAIDYVQLYWWIEGDDLSGGEITMDFVAGNTWTSQWGIPGHEVGTTIVYQVHAVDVEFEGTYSAEQSYTVVGPVTTTLPYAETFDTDLGDCYVYSVSGPTKYWMHGSFGGDGFAGMNGWNTGDIEEDWLILPGIDMTLYGDVLMSFATAYNFGNDDDNNYLKLHYSTDYTGLGDPTLATWTELVFNQPVTGSYNWEDSGLLSLPDVADVLWLGFEYRYEPGNYRAWQVDNIQIFEATTPILYVVPTSLEDFAYVIGEGPSLSQSFVVEGENLINNVFVDAPANYEISLSVEEGYTNQLILEPFEGVLGYTTVYTRLIAGLDVGAYNEEIVVSSQDALNVNVSLSGQVAPEPIAGYFVDFEDDNTTFVSGSTGYASGIYELNGLEWDLVESLIGSLAGDWKNGEKSLRMRGYAASSITMLGNKANGAGTVSFYYRRYGGDAQVDWMVEVSSDDGVSWTQIGDAFTAPDSDDVQLFSEEVNVEGEVRIRIKRATEEGSANRRLNIDDIAISDYDGGVVEPDAEDTAPVAEDSPVPIDFPNTGVTIDFGGTNPAQIINSLFFGFTPDGDLPAGVINVSPAFWTITSDSATPGEYYITFDLSGIPGIQNPAGLHLLKRDTPLDPWVSMGFPNAPVVMPELTWGPFTSFSDFALGGDETNTLPVELSSFTANVTASSFVELQWTAETETNMLGYHVYRGVTNSVSEASAITANVIPAANSSTVQDYSYVDEDVANGQTYYYWLQSIDLDLTMNFHGPVAVSLEDETELPDPVFTTALRKNFPNPFNPETTIKYSLRDDTHLELKIYNLLGQLVKTVHAGHHEKGDHEFVWNGKSDAGQNVSSGIYFYRMSTPNYDRIHKMMLLK